MQTFPAMAASTPALSYLLTTHAYNIQKKRKLWNSSKKISCNITENGETNETENMSKKKVVIVGATGRVGGSTARALAKSCPNLHLILAGRNRDKGAKLAAELGPKADFCELDIDNAKSLTAAITGVDVVVHTAGPFQRNEKCTVLEAAISSKAAYIDVCDDRGYSCLAKTFHEKAVAAGVPAITTAGIYPGVSNLMAAELVRLAKNGSEGTPPEPERLRLSRTKLMVLN